MYLNNKMNDTKLNIPETKFEKRTFIHNYSSENDIHLIKNEVQNNNNENIETTENKEINQSNNNSNTKDLEQQK